MPSVTIATTDIDIARCFAVLHELRPHLSEGDFIERIRRMQQGGFEMAFVADEGGAVVAVAGYRYLEQLAAGLVLYVDDLVTSATARSRGHGSRLLDWLYAMAQQAGCEAVELDSAVHRADAHRFYFRERFSIIGYHFRREC